MSSYVPSTFSLCEGILIHGDVKTYINERFPGLIAQIERAVESEKPDSGEATCNVYGCFKYGAVVYCEEHAQAFSQERVHRTAQMILEANSRDNQSGMSDRDMLILRTGYMKLIEKLTQGLPELA